MFRRIIDKAYSKRYLVFTNTLAGVISMSLGDILQQNFESSYRTNGQQNTAKTHIDDIIINNNNNNNDNKNNTRMNLPLFANDRKPKQAPCDANDKLGSIINQSKNDCDLKCDTTTDRVVSPKDYFVWDPVRTRNMAVAGVYFSLFGHYWYSYLDRKFPPKLPGSVLKKVLSECFMGPLLVSNCFFVVGSVKGQTLEQCWKYLKSNWLIIIGVEWAVYIPLQWLNFALVPAQYRYLYVASISLAYDAFLSYIFHRNERNEAAQRNLEKYLIEKEQKKKFNNDY